jgi:hypothetical protein
VARHKTVSIHQQLEKTMTRFHKITAVAVVALGASLCLGGVAASAQTSGSQLTSDISSAVQSGELATANDQTQAAEDNVDDGQVENVDSQDNETGDHQTGASTNDQSTASDGEAGATANGQSAESSGDKGATTNGQSGANGENR